MIDEYAYLGFPLEPSEVKQIAFNFAEENNIDGFSTELGTAGCAWFTYLLKRHPILSYKEPPIYPCKEHRLHHKFSLCTGLKSTQMCWGKWALISLNRYGMWMNIELSML